MDEAGIIEGLGFNGLVLGSAKSKITVVKQAGSRNWTTIVEYISATGHSLPPLVIFRGTHL